MLRGDSPPPAGALAEPQPPRAMAGGQPAALAPPRLSPAETSALVARGDALVSLRDIASARLYYDRAVEIGDGRGALRMGKTFDPAFFDRVGIRGTKGDKHEALSWYRRARDLDDAEADHLLENLEPLQP